MCGIVAVIGKMSVAEEKAFAYMLQLDTVRGEHSTGVLGVNISNATRISKKAGTPWDLFKEESYKALTRGFNKILLGHNRYATKGSINDDNAHPFECGHLIGVHNGTLRNQHVLDDNHKFPVDSENLYHHMSKHGVKETIKKVNGAMALAWYDAKENTFNLFRNYERPLCYAWSEDGKTMFVASEPFMIYVALEKEKIKHQKIKILPTNTLLSVEIQDKKIYEMGVLMYREEIMEVYTTPVSNFFYGNQGGNKQKKENDAGVGVARKRGSLSLLQNTPADPVGQDDDVDNTTGITHIGLYKKLKKLQGTDVTFNVLDQTVVKNKQYCFTVEILEAPGVQGRVFCSTANANYKLLLDTTRSFVGHVTGFQQTGTDGYVTINPDDLAPIAKIELEEEDEFFAYGFEKEPLTYQEWIDSTACGCNKCGAMVAESSADSIKWISLDAFICPKCLNKKERA